MEFIVVLIALGVQKLWPEGTQFHPTGWFRSYYFWIKTQAQKLSAWRDNLSLIVVVAPLLLVLAVLASALHGLLGHFLLGILVLWYCLGFDQLKSDSVKGIDSFLLGSYHLVFAVVFWYGLLGVFGLGLYFSLTQLRAVLKTDNSEKTLAALTMMVLGVMDWVPARLLGISFALVGNFSVLFPIWVKELPGKINDAEEHVVEWGNKALEHSSADSKPTPASAKTLVERSLMLWLVALALISIGSWVG